MFHSIVDGKRSHFQSRYGRELGFFLIEKVAQYEGDFLEDKHTVLKYVVFEKNNTDEESRIAEFRENYSTASIFHTYITHPKTKRTFNLLLAYR